MQSREGEDELAAPVGDVAELLDQLPFQVPRQGEHHVRAVSGDAPRFVYRDAGPGCEPAMLVRVAVDGVFEQVGADPAVVEQSVPFARRAVADDPLALGAAL